MPTKTINYQADSLFELASLFLALWSRADGELRADLEHTIRAYVQRNPGFRTVLLQVVAFNEQARQLTNSYTRYSISTTPHRDTRRPE